MSLFGALPWWKERAYLFMAVDSTVKGLVYIVPDEVMGFEVPTLRDEKTIFHRVRTNLSRAKGFLDEVIGEKVEKLVEAK